MNFERIKAIQAKNNTKILDIKPGMFVEIHEKLGEAEWNRIWKFKWLVIKVKNPQQADGTFTVRATIAGNDIEKIYPLSFPKFDKVLLLDQYKTRRAKLYYIREKVWRKASKLRSNLPADQRNTDLQK